MSNVLCLMHLLCAPALTLPLYLSLDWGCLAHAEDLKPEHIPGLQLYPHLCQSEVESVPMKKSHSAESHVVQK